VIRIEITAGQLPGALKRRERAVLTAIARGARRGAFRGKAMLVKATPVDQGEMRAAWKVRSFAFLREMAEIDNDAPHAGVVEMGARPHKVSREGIEALTAWVWRHRKSLGLVTASGRARGGEAAKAKARSIAWAIAKKIEKRGQRPTYFIRNLLPDIGRVAGIEIDAAINRLSNQRSPH